MAYLLACFRMFQPCRIFRRYITCMVSVLFRNQASILGNKKIKMTQQPRNIT